MWSTAGIAITVHSNDPSNCAFNPDYIEQFGDDYNSSWGTQVKRKGTIKKTRDTKEKKL